MQQERDTRPLPAGERVSSTEIEDQDQQNDSSVNKDQGDPYTTALIRLIIQKVDARLQSAKSQIENRLEMITGRGPVSIDDVKQLLAQAIEKSVNAWAAMGNPKPFFNTNNEERKATENEMSVNGELSGAECEIAASPDEMASATDPSVRSVAEEAVSSMEDVDRQDDLDELKAEITKNILIGRMILKKPELGGQDEDDEIREFK